MVLPLALIALCWIRVTQTLSLTAQQADRSTDQGRLSSLFRTYADRQLRVGFRRSKMLSSSSHPSNNSQQTPTGKRILCLLSNLHLPQQWEWASDSWKASFTCDFALSQVRESDLVLIDGNISLLTKVVLAGMISRRYRKPLVVVDVVLRPPGNRIKARVLRMLLGRVDFFIHYFRDLRGYDKFYNIGPTRSAYVPFKPNLRSRYEPRFVPGEYVLCFGESMRDYDTFFRAMAALPFPGAITKRAAAHLQQSGSCCSPPANIHLLDDDYSQDSMIRIIEAARFVVVTVRPENICGSGISTYLNSMLLGKAVIVTEGPGVSDVLSEEVLSVPPKHPDALRAAITRLWYDDTLCSQLSVKGRLYAESLGGEVELYERIRSGVMKWYYEHAELTV